jgi:hypothetical protein
VRRGVAGGQRARTRGQQACQTPGPRPQIEEVETSRDENLLNGFFKVVLPILAPDQALVLVSLGCVNFFIV